MAILIEGKTADDVWRESAGMLLKENKVVTGRGGTTRELMHVFFSIKDPRQRWAYNRLPPMSLAFAFAELIWIMNGEDRSDIVNFWNPSVSRYAGNGETYYGAYGKRLRSHFGFDQLFKACEALQNVPESRQVVIQIYDAKTDFPIKAGQPRNADIPCNICAMLKIRDNKLEWSQTVRSNDIFIGVPYDFAYFTSVQEIMAGWLGVQVGSYNHYSDSLHLYDHNFKNMKIGQNLVLKNEDVLSLPEDESEKIFAEIYSRMTQIISEHIPEKALYTLGNLDSQYSAYNNIMFVIAAYAAKKFGYTDLTNEFIQHCSNPLYCLMWEKWVAAGMKSRNNIIKK